MVIAQPAVIDSSIDLEYAALLRELTALARAVGAGDDAEDIAQETLVHGREKLSQLRDPTSLRPWLRRSAVRRVAARRQRQFATQQLDDRVWAPVDSSLGMDLAAAVASLPIRERQALGLVYGLGYSEAETAATLGIRRGTVASSLFRARRKLAMALADYRDRGGR